MDNNNNIKEGVKWMLFGRQMPRSAVMYFVQVFIAVLLIVASVVNLSINKGDDKLWTTLLTTSIAYLLPAPSQDYRNG